jgi:hypothetical protein
MKPRLAMLAVKGDAHRTRLAMPGRRSFKTDESFYRPKLGPSDHDISRRFASNNGGAIPLNYRKSAIRNLKSQIKRGVALHPARFPEKPPGFFIGRAEIQTAKYAKYAKEETRAGMTTCVAIPVTNNCSRHISFSRVSRGSRFIVFPFNSSIADL